MQLEERVVATHSLLTSSCLVFINCREANFLTTHQEGLKVSGAYGDVGETADFFLTLITLISRRAQLSCLSPLRCDKRYHCPTTTPISFMQLLADCNTQNLPMRQAGKAHRVFLQAGGFIKLHKTHLLLLLLEWFYSPCWPWPPFQFPDLITIGRTAWTSDQLVARPLPKYRTTQTQKNTYTHQTSMP
jgi:hypothetical protein